MESAERMVPSNQVVGGYDGSLSHVRDEWVWGGHCYDRLRGKRRPFRFSSPHKPPNASTWVGHGGGVQESIDLRFIREPAVRAPLKHVWRVVGRGSNRFGVFSLAGLYDATGREGDVFFCEKRLLLARFPACHRQRQLQNRNARSTPWHPIPPLHQHGKFAIATPRRDQFMSVC